MSDPTTVLMPQFDEKPTKKTLDELPGNQTPEFELLGKYVLITTLHLGVFGGKLKKINHEKQFAILEETSLVLYWNDAMQGLFGLCSKGPGPECRLTPAASGYIYNVTLCMEIPEEVWQRTWAKRPFAAQ